MLTVLKLGGSVLSDAAGYRRAAHFVADRVASDPAGSWLVVASAAFGETDGLLASARAIAAEPDAATLDLLWSTGEVRSAAIVALHLQACGLRACALNVHQAGLVEDGDRRPGHAAVRSLAVRAALAVHDVVVVPGFLARAAGDAVVSLGRGGSDLTAVLLASALGARRCELVKDVPGYFSSDPHIHPGARPIPALDFAGALAMADGGCDLVQRHALEAAARHCLPLVVRSVDGEGATHIS